jgi:peptide/nickel transport system substrate-binding protein
MLVTLYRAGLFLISIAATSAAVLSPAQAQSRERTLFITSPGVPNGLDYDGPAGGHKPSAAGMSNIIEPLVDYALGPDNGDGMTSLNFHKFVGRLAESWSYDAATLTWTLNLRRGVKGCNGATFNADDVLYTFARGKSISGTSPIFWFLANNAGVDNFTGAVFGARGAANKAKEEGKPAPSPDARDLGDEVKKVDDYTIQIRLAAPNKLLFTNLTIFAMLIYDKEIMEENATADDPWSHSYPDEVSAPSFSPWCTVRWEKDREFVADRNNDYYGEKPFFERVITRKVSQSANRMTILQSGDSDITEFLTVKEYEHLRGVDGINVAGGFLNAGAMLWMNWTKPPFDNVTFRKAIAHLIPYDKVLNTAYLGQARRWRGYVPSVYPGYHEPSTQYDTNVARGKALLAEAGFPGGAGLDKFADSLQLTYSIEREAAMGPTAVVIQSALRAAGIPIQLNPIPETIYADRALAKKDMPLSMNDTSRPLGIDAGFATQLFFASVDKGGISNFSRYSNATVDELWLKAKVEPDEQKRNAILAEIQELVADDVYWVSLAEYKLQYAFRDDIEGLTLQPGQHIRWADLRRK